MLSPPKSTVYTEAHSLCCTFYRFGQMCDDVHLLGWAWGLPARARISGESSGNKGSISQADIGAPCDHLALPTSLTSCHHALYTAVCTFQRRRRRLKQATQGHTAAEWPRWGLMPGQRQPAPALQTLSPAGCCWNSHAQTYKVGTAPDTLATWQRDVKDGGS